MTHNTVLIADCGATKCEWALHSTAGNTGWSASRGFNPNVVPGSEVKKMLLEAAEVNQWLQNAPGRIYFFGAGCGTAHGNASVTRSLQELFPQAAIQVQNDIMGAALALYEKRPLVACILGTGSASLYFDGQHTRPLRASLGWTIGDEGGGCAIGKRVLRNVFYRLWPQPVLDAFYEQYPGLTIEKFLQTMREDASPNRFLASFAPFASRYIHIAGVRQEVYDELENFVRWQVSPFCAEYGCEAAFCGSVAHYFGDILREICEKNGTGTGKIIARPLPELVDKLALNA